jgi:hypothetical protein
MEAERRSLKRNNPDRVGARQGCLKLEAISGTVIVLSLKQFSVKRFRIGGIM